MDAADKELPNFLSERGGPKWSQICPEVRANLFDWSDDAKLGDAQEEQQHALTSKSLQYDVGKVIT